MVKKLAVSFVIALVIFAIPADLLNFANLLPPYNSNTSEITLAATPSPEATPSPTLTPEVTAEPTATPTLVPTPTPEPTPVPTPTPMPYSVDYPYLIDINQGAQIITVFTLDEDGKYTVPVRYMICSTSKKVGKTPNGLFKTKDSYRWRQMYSEEMTYGQYCTRITGSFLFHSVPSSSNNGSTMSVKDYNLLGQRASGGCVRLLVCDAKWIYDNIPKGSPVRIHTSEPNPELWEALKPPPYPGKGARGWDPTDPDPKNPNYDPTLVAAPLATPYPWATPAPLDEKFSKDVAPVSPRLPGMNTPQPATAPPVSATEAPAATAPPKPTAELPAPDSDSED